MPLRPFHCLILSVCLALLLGIAFQSSAEPEPRFDLPATDGTRVSIPNETPARMTVLCFLGTECPLAKLYGPRLQKLFEQYESEGVAFIGINSNRQDSREELKAYAKEHGITFPVVKDYDNKAADHFGATRTPEVIVLDAAGEVRYRGRIDDQYEPGIARTRPTRDDLKIAIEELLAGRSVSIPKTEPAGCLIGKNPISKKPTDVTYCREVSRILQHHCVECHRPGEIGPFALTEYEEIVGWGDMLVEVIDEGRMPPWHASPKFGHFANAREILESDKAALKEWVAGGMPFGDEQDLPAAYQGVKGWQLPRQPDLVLNMSQSPFAVPAEGVVGYQYFVIDPKFSEDKWVSGAQVIPGNAAVVHHCIVFIRPPDGAEFRGAGFLTGYVPGQRTALMPAGRARRIPAGSRLVFQMHYTPTGTPQSDLTKIGLLFANEKEITHEVITLTALNRDFEIPPRDPDYQVTGGISRLPDIGEILAITPHMHYRGKSFRVWAERGKDSEVLLDVPKYDFNWQHIYELAEPWPMDKIDKLHFRAGFDNSADNPFNPDPDQHVTWGDQTWEEMAIAFFEVSVPRDATTKRSKRRSQSTDRDEQKIDKFVEQFFHRFDANGDGVIHKSELPIALGRFGFRQFDRDGNEILDREEVRAHAAKRDF